MYTLSNTESIEINAVFKCRSEHQKFLIEFVLAYSCLKLKDLADILEVNQSVMTQVRIGSGTLPHQAVIKLVDVFCML